MNEIPLYRQTTDADRRLSLWVGAAVLLLIAATSLYMGRAEDNKLTVGNSAVSAESRQSADSELKNINTKSMSDTELRKRLTPEQYHVTRENGTEPPFNNAYWDNHKPGIYVDLISGEA